MNTAKHFNSVDIMEKSFSAVLGEEYERWLQNYRFIYTANKQKMSRFQSYEYNGMLSRFLLGWHNHPEHREQVKNKAIAELSEKNMNFPIPFKLLEDNPTVPSKPSLPVYIRVSKQLLKDNLVVLFEAWTPKKYNFRFELPYSLYAKLIKYTSVENIFKMLMRYDGVLAATSGQFWGMPEKTWELLITKYGAEYEGFASPLNFNLNKFFSLFLDTDEVFGSLGNFLTAELKPGVYVANPPYIESIMLLASHKILETLEHSTAVGSKTTFFMLLPHWLDAPSIQNLIESKYLQVSITLQKKKHLIRNYTQNINMVANFENLIVILSNNPEEKYNVEELKQSFL